MLKVGAQLFCITLHPTVMHHQIRSGYKRLSNFKDIFWTNWTHKLIDTWSWRLQYGNQLETPNSFGKLVTIYVFPIRVNLDLSCLPEHRPKSMETSLNRDCPYGLTLITDCPKQMSPSHSHSPEVSTDATLILTRGLNRCYTHTHQRPQQMLHSHSPEASTNATLTYTRGLNRCYTHTHQRPQQMLHSHSPEVSTETTLILTRGLNRCYTHTHQRPQQMLPSHSQETIFTGGFLQQRPP